MAYFIIGLLIIIISKVSKALRILKDACKYAGISKYVLKTIKYDIIKLYYSRVYLPVTFQYCLQVDLCKFMHARD